MLWKNIDFFAGNIFWRTLSLFLFRHFSELLCEQSQNHRLHTVAAHCGFDLENHCHTLSDAEACAAIMMKAL
jgi:DNA polymerase III epsilon subunit-like protein